MSSYYSKEELKEIGFRSFGDHIFVSRKASIYEPGAISLGNYVRVDDFCMLSGGEEIVIGNYVHIAAYSAIYGGGVVIFEDYTGLSPRCTVFSESDDFSGNSMIHPFLPAFFKPGYISKRSILRRFSQVGANSTLLPGAELGEGVAVGAHSLVTRYCEPWGIYAGVPVRRIKNRSRKLLELHMQYLKQLRMEEIPK